jgi:hypothetical protein
MTPCQEPHIIQLLHGLWNGCCELLQLWGDTPPGMTTTTVFVELPVIVAFVFGVKCYLNSSMISIPYFLTSTPAPSFHTTDSRSFVSSFVIQLSGWHLKMIPLGSCSLGIVLWFRIVCGGNLLWSANAANMTVTRLFRNSLILPHCHWQCNWMVDESTVAFCRYFLFSWAGNCAFSESNHLLL